MLFQALASPGKSTVQIHPHALRLQSRGIAMLAGCLLALALTLPKALQVWSTGVFLNPDDAMRAVEVRDFLAGQGWFDLVPHRLSPDHPFTMHWSRLVDLPLALMVRVFALILRPTSAELAMRLLEPALLFGLSLWVSTGIVRDLMGPRALLPAALLLAGSAEFVGNFIPGHIHHHGLQATLLLGATKSMLDGLGPRARATRAAWAGALAALSLGIGLQNLPFVAALATVACLAWVVEGEGEACRSMSGFGAGLTATSGAVFLLDVPPRSYTQGACDAFSAAHLVAACAVGAAFLVMGLGSARLSSRPLRFLAALVSALFVLGLVAAAYPVCLGDPMAGVDPLLRSQWLADVGEALPLARLIELKPSDGLVMLLTLLIGTGATVAAARNASVEARPRWLALLMLAGVGVAGTLWQVRVAASTAAFMVPGVTWLVVAVFDRLSVDPKRPALLCAVLAGLIGNGAGLAAAAAVVDVRPTPAARPNAALSIGDPSMCFEPSAYTALHALPAGLVLSTIDPGSTILAYTNHSVLAAPYHRNTYGNRVALLAFAATPDAAHPIIAEARVRYIALCRASNEVAEAAQRHPESLAARLLSKDPPNWLVPIGSERDVVSLYRVADSSLSVRHSRQD